MPASRQAWLLGILALALPALALVAKLPAHPLILGVLNNAAHAPVFGATAVAVFVLLRLHPRIPRPAAWLSAWLLAVAIGGAVELIQPSIGRSAEWNDFWNDAIGAAGALSLASLWQARELALSQRARWVAVLVLLVAVTVWIWPVARVTVAYAVRAERFPTLFEDLGTFDRYFLRSRGVELTHLEPAALGVRIVGNRFPGITLIEPEPDWTAYRRILLDLANPGDRPLQLTLRVHDERHDNRMSDRFNRRIDLPPRSRHTIAIPLEEIASAPAHRRLELDDVAGLMLFSAGEDSDRGQSYQVLRIWLE